MGAMHALVRAESQRKRAGILFAPQELQTRMRCLNLGLRFSWQCDRSKGVVGGSSLGSCLGYGASGGCPGRSTQVLATGSPRAF